MAAEAERQRREAQEIKELRKKMEFKVSTCKHPAYRAARNGQADGGTGHQVSKSLCPN